LIFVFLKLNCTWKRTLQESSVLTPQNHLFSISIFIKEVSDYHDTAEPVLGILNLVVPHKKDESLSVALKLSVKLVRNFLHIIV